ncbi:MAG: class I SAM-dependent methyltransferase [Bdellovibrionales bacterium]|nr:class I SAM-dependent methyltransferase [Bdellovibrionales bacterium]
MSRPQKFPATFDKYDYYSRAVQSPKNDVQFFKKVFRDLKKKKPKTMREDFCGTFELSRAWVRSGPEMEAVGVDLDLEPISYGLKGFKEMTVDQQRRLDILNKNVLDKNLPTADLVAAMNFSHYIFKDRKVMLEYFKNCYRGVNKGGLFILDCFGGSESYEPNEERTQHEGFVYYWDQDSFDPVTNEGQFYIHFKVKGYKKKFKKVFSYDWRLWSIPELRDILDEAGFKKTHIYWEGTTKTGEGDGNFNRVTEGEYCESWIAYIACEK